MTLDPSRIVQNIPRTPMLLEIFVGHSAGEDGFAVIAVGFDGGEARCDGGGGAAEEGAGGGGGG